MQTTCGTQSATKHNAESASAGECRLAAGGAAATERCPNLEEDTVELVGSILPGFEHEWNRDRASLRRL